MLWQKIFRLNFVLYSKISWHCNRRVVTFLFLPSDLEGTNTEENYLSVRQAGEGDVTSSPVPGDGGGGGDGSSGHGRWVNIRLRFMQATKQSLK